MVAVQHGHILHQPWLTKNWSAELSCGQAVVLNWGSPKNDGKPLDFGRNSASASFPPWSHMSNVWRQSPDPTQVHSLDVVTSNRKIRRSAVPQRIRSGCVSLTDFKTAVGMQRGRVNIPKRCSAIEKSANRPKRRFVMEQMCFQHAQKDVSRQELCRQHAKTRFAIEKRAVNIPKRRLAIEKTCPQDATLN